MNALQTESGNPVIEFSCGHCGGRLSVPVAYAGVEGPCPKCGENVVSPAVEPTLPEGVAEFVPLNRSNLREEDGEVEVTEGRKRRSGVPMRTAGIRGFVAKQRIEGEWGQDDSWRERRREETRRLSRKKKLNRRIGRWFDPSRFEVAAEFLAPAAIFIVVGTVVFMKLNGWGLSGDAEVTGAEAASEMQAGVLAEVAHSLGSGGGGEEIETESSNIAAFERVRAAASDAVEREGE